MGIEVILDASALAQVQQALPEYASALERAFAPVVKAVTAPALRTLQTPPGAPRYPLRWRSARQRRYVMAKLRREGNLPYRRTGRLARSWQIVFRSRQVVLRNDTPYAMFVQADWVQPYHLDTGWPQVNAVIDGLPQQLANALVKTWAAVTAAG